MARTVTGGSSPRQVAANRGRELEKKEQEFQRGLKELRNFGKPKPTGPVKRS